MALVRWNRDLFFCFIGHDLPICSLQQGKCKLGGFRHQYGCFIFLPLGVIRGVHALSQGQACRFLRNGSDSDVLFVSRKGKIWTVNALIGERNAQGGLFSLLSCVLGVGGGSKVTSASLNLAKSGFVPSTPGSKILPFQVR